MLAQTVQTGPAEQPPETFTARQYVDSKGCVFQRAGISGAMIWVPRLNADRQPVCGLDPSLIAPAAPAAVAAVSLPAAEPVPVAPVVAAPKAAKAVAAPRPAVVALVESGSLAKANTLCVGMTGIARRYLVSDGRRITKCGNRAEDAVPFLNGLKAPGLVVTTDAPTADEIRRARAAGRAGYRLVWSNGALRPAMPGLQPVPAVTMRWVQVGAFGQQANADRAIADLKKLGLPSARQKLEAGGQVLTAVLAGPYEDQDGLVAALDMLQRSGFPEAFARR